MLYKILLVDDDESFLEELGECLSEYNLVYAQSGAQAIALLKKSNMIDLMILDIHLPDIPGIDVLTEVRKTRPDLAVVILTGEGKKDVVVDALRAHADDYLEKPFDIVELKSVMQKILKAKKYKNVSEFSGGIPGKIALAKRFAACNADKRISLKEVADEVCLSPKYFSRIFKEATGQGFNAYRLGLKMEDIKRFLKESPLPMAQIAHKFGYQDIKSFNRIFKKYTGLTPAVYKRKLRIKSSKSK